MRRYATAFAALVAAFAGWTYFRATRAEREALQAVRSESEIRFEQQTLSDPPPAGWETIASPADFRDAVVWNGELYVAGANALFRYRVDGTLLQTWRAGMELPPAPLMALAAGEELWVATEGEGALSFDGARIRRILPPARKVNAVLPLSTGAVLFGTVSQGVLRYDGTHLRPAHPSLASLAVTAIAGAEDDLWVGTRDAGVVHLRAGHAERFSEAEGLPDKAVHSIAVDGDRAWVGTSTGIAAFQDGKLQRVIGKGLLAKSLAARGNELLAGTLSDGWLRIPLEGRAPRPAAAGVSQGGEVRRVFSVGEDVYILRPESLDVLRAGRISKALNGQSALLTHGNVSALEMDASGRLWVGYFDRGLDIVEMNRRRITPVEDERIFCVNRIRRSEDGQRVAVATANGLVFFDGGLRQRQVMTRADGLIASHVTDIVPRGRGWVAATPAGLTFLDGGTRSVYAFHGLVNNHVYAAAAEGETVLAGTLGGLSAMRGETVKTSYTTANSALKTNWITALARSGTDWFAGTYGGGVQRLDSAGVWHTFDSMPANVVVNPNAMTATPRGVYAGTLEHGLLVWDFQRQAWRSIRKGLPSANVTAILYHDNKLYLGTGNGLAVVPESLLGL